MMNTCRFCSKGNGEDKYKLDLIKYGIRHYAHPDCLLKAKREGAWVLLADWKLDSFPFFAAKRAGLEQSLLEACAGRRQRTV
jgi:hypothetical protein